MRGKESSQKTIEIALPCSKNNVEKLCSELDSLDYCRITQVVGDYDYLKDFVGQTVVVSDLIFLLDILCSFSKKEMLRFYACVNVQKADTLESLINIAYNIDCCSAIKELHDLQAVGIEFYDDKNRIIYHRLNCFDSFDYISYANKIIKMNPNPINTSIGYLYKNDNEYKIISCKDALPRLKDCQHDCVEPLDIEINNKTAYLYLPCSHDRIRRVLKSLNVDELYDGEVRLSGLTFFDSLIDIVCSGSRQTTVMKKLCKLSDFANELLEFEIREDFKKIFDLFRPQNTSEMLSLIKAYDLDNFAIFDNITDVQSYADELFPKERRFTSAEMFYEFVFKVDSDEQSCEEIPYILYDGVDEDVIELISRKKQKETSQQN